MDQQVVGANNIVDKVFWTYFNNVVDNRLCNGAELNNFVY